MPLVTLNEVLYDAKKYGYAVGSFNALDLNLFRGILQAAEEENSPVIINLGQGQFRFTPIEIMAPIMVKMAKESRVPVVIHLDHGKDIDICLKALRLGFSSVMYDGSALSFEENLANTQTVVKFAKLYGASVEAEIGKVGNAETGEVLEETNSMLQTEADQYTSPEEAEKFARLSGVDALAVAFGTAHGLYHGTPKLDFDRLRTIAQCVDIPLVMHGGSGLDESVYADAIGCQISKINYFTNMSHDVGKKCKDLLNSVEEEYYHDLILHSINATKEHAAHMMRVFKSSGEA